jgi:hypothetical protein
MRRSCRSATTHDVTGRQATAHGQSVASCHFPAPARSLDCAPLRAVAAMAVPRSPARAGAAAALCVLAMLCSSAAATSASNILVLNGDASFDAALAAHDFLVVDFYAPVRLRR